MTRKTHHSNSLFRYWWISLVAGILSFTAGICCFAVPAGSIAALTAFFIAVLIAGGFFNLGWAIANRNWNDDWGWSLARGILEILLGVWLLMLPLPLVATMLIYVIGIWMMFHSILGICESCTLSKYEGSGWGWLLACSIPGLISSFLFLAVPLCGGLLMLAYIGISFLLYGIFRIVLSFRLRSINRRLRAEEEYIEAEIVE